MSLPSKAAGVVDKAVGDMVVVAELDLMLVYKELSLKMKLAR
jgi:hypothetical protein